MPFTLSFFFIWQWFSNKKHKWTTWDVMKRRRCFSILSFHLFSENFSFPFINKNKKWPPEISPLLQFYTKIDQIVIIEVENWKQPITRFLFQRFIKGKSWVSTFFSSFCFEKENFIHLSISTEFDFEDTPLSLSLTSIS